MIKAQRLCCVFILVKVYKIVSVHIFDEVEKLTKKSKKKTTAKINGNTNITKCANPFNVVGRVSVGDVVTIGYRSNGYTQITFKKITGYVPDYFITLLKDN